MKKFFMLALFFASTGFCGAEDNQVVEIQLLIQNGLRTNYELIAEKSSLLTPAEKLFLYDAYEKSAGVPAAVNMIIGFGLGSYMHGDAVSGTIQLSGETLGILVFHAGYAGVRADLAVITALTLYTLSRLYGGVSPFVFARSYNRRLKNAVRYDNALTYQILPSIDEKGNARVSSLVSFKL
ncbi:MAG: P13 family porin [Treponema sp.]|jgi:hypothetical protein|nr:P13 family porin [Treponema sp.]